MASPRNAIPDRQRPGYRLTSTKPMPFHPRALFHRSERHEGVRRIHLYALRLVYGMARGAVRR
ncbi:hypothetical protein HBN54_000794 [Hymenobacter sp. 1B]|uniref:Uncharacterized protein n=1 Tax=Hymenobacter artigasi TaxID=2719616 RepID=A0ABX1HGK3_9BACT|nr:hypothetical protein [Hymenobacter artigasi]